MSSHNKEQETIVLKILSYKPNQYYEILSVDRTASDSDIKKSYRKLAVKLHPDKNPHPRASEAFKYVNKAWGVLSDPAKKVIYDQTGSDPDSRSSGIPENATGSPFARSSGFNSYAAGSDFENDIFNMFFGGQTRGAQTFTFGNNGFTFQTNGAHPFFANTQGTRRARPQQTQEDNSLFNSLKQLLPILLFLFIPLLSSFFSESSTQDYSFVKTKSYNVERQTPRYKIPYFVNDKFITKKNLSDKQLRNFDSKIESIFIQEKRSKCSKEQILKNEMMDDAQGWFFTDFEKLKRAESMPMPNCQILRQMDLI